MDITVSPSGWIAWGGRRVRCALGRGGVRLDKREGDGATPVGDYPLRHVLYRPDRVARPLTTLACRELRPEDGWCDDPADPNYNRPVTLPYPARHETMWRDDALYDMVVVLGHNDDPVVPGLGSAVFMHVARPDFGPTEGCVALALPDLLHLLEDCGPASRLIVAPSA
ncbi:MAG TPA: L,D-transpeptidase family protein [Alphaproteobacteria bacterium]|nr:L,D-transpeptidase family protein [Alphaproteobacteria bacterium]